MEQRRIQVFVDFDGYGRQGRLERVVVAPIVLRSLFSLACVNAHSTIATVVSALGGYFSR
jgi:hypothetical protein